MKPTLQNISGIDALSVLSTDPSVAVIFLHGYGANMQDLFPLWEMWHRPNFNWYFPNGVEPLPMGYYEGRAWFSIDMAKLELAMRTGKSREMSGEIPVEFASTLKRLETFILELQKKHSKIILGGFSQGAMCASHLATMSSLKIDGLVLLSGNLIAEKLLPPVARGIPFYQSHGIQDPVLSIAGARDLEAKMKMLNLQGKLHEFNGGHEIPQSVISGVKNFLLQFE